MKILISEEKARPDGGQERCLLEVAEGLAKRGHQLQLLYQRPGNFLPIYRGFGCRVKKVPGLLLDPRRPMSSVLQLLRTIAEGVRADPDLFYINDYQHAAYGAAASLLRRVPLVCHLYLLPPQAFARQLRLSLPRVTRFIAVAEHVRTKFVDNGLAPNRVDVVHIGVDLDRYSPGTVGERQSMRLELGFRDDELVIMFAGRLDRAKGIEVLIAAVKAFRGRNPEARLLIVGGPVWHADQATAASYVDSLKRSTDPSWCTWLDPRLDVIPLYRAADVVVVPSIWEEPFSRVVVEAMACGRPVVGSSAGGTPEALTGELQPMIFESGNASALVDVLEWVKPRARQLGRLCREHAETRFGLSTMIDKIQGVFDRALAAPLEGAVQEHGDR